MYHFGNGMKIGFERWASPNPRPPSEKVNSFYVQFSSILRRFFADFTCLKHLFDLEIYFQHKFHHHSTYSTCFSEYYSSKVKKWFHIIEMGYFMIFPKVYFYLAVKYLFSNHSNSQELKLVFKWNNLYQMTIKHFLKNSENMSFFRHRAIIFKKACWICTLIIEFDDTFVTNILQGQ